ncbi:unnamed protein product, partial [marine sediment metagenome]
QNTGTLGRFVRFLTYKAELIGKRVIEISEKDTSKTCCVCGKKHDMPLYKRIIKCDCGNHIDRDINSSINIMSRFLSQNAKWTGYQLFADNLRQTGLSIKIDTRRKPLALAGGSSPTLYYVNIDEDSSLKSLNQKTF